jgi:hypothetical protein
MILRVATSITCTRSESLAQMYSSLLSWDSSRPRGRWPTGRVSVTCRVCMSIRLRLLSFSLETQAVAGVTAGQRQGARQQAGVEQGPVEEGRRMADSLLLWLSGQG